jgi:hypothetical protein
MNSGSFDKFLSPESMLTPGLAGGMTMGITNALAFQFNLIAPQPALIALILSFLFGLCVFLSAKSGIGRGAKALFWVINSLVIFTVAAGSNSIGSSASLAQTSGTPRVAVGVIERLVPSAHAQTAAGWCCVDGSVKPLSAAQCNEQKGKVAESKDKAQQACEADHGAEKRRERGFFGPWLRPTTNK